MKKLLLSMIAAAVLAGHAVPAPAAPQSRPAAEAASTQAQLRKPKEQAGKNWRKGARYDGRGSAVRDPARHKLKTPPKGHRWVREGDRFLLIATATGIIASIVSAK